MVRQLSVHSLWYGPVSRVRDSFQSVAFALRGRSYAVMALLLTLALTYWMWFGLTRALNRDESISVLAAQGILEHGYQLLPSGYLYHRGYAQHYMVAGSIGVFGLNDFAIMLPSLLMALTSLWLVYRLARDIIGRPWVGVATVALMFLGVQLQTTFATGPRFYMALQFFTILATYSAWRGYVQGDGVRFKILTFVAIAGATLSHREGVALAVAIPLSVMIVGWMAERKRPPVPSVWALVGIALVASAIAYMIVYEPVRRQPIITAYAVETAGLASLDPDVGAWADGILEPKRAFLYLLSMTPIVLFAVVSFVRRRWRDTPQGLVYILLVATVCFLLLMVSTARVESRLWFFLVPLYGLLFWTGVALTVENFGPRAGKWLRHGTAIRVATVLLVATAALATLGVASYTALGPEFVRLAIAKGAGPRCSGWCDSAVKEHYGKLRQVVEPGDLIISTNPVLTRYYMGRADGYLREKVIIEHPATKNEKITAYDSLTDEYLGIPLIDVSDLPDLLNGERRVFIIADYSVTRRTSEETRAFLNTQFPRLYDEDLIVTYVSCVVAPCTPSAGQ